jgi:hypothetical protein
MAGLDLIVIHPHKIKSLKESTDRIDVDSFSNLTIPYRAGLRGKVMGQASSILGAVVSAGAMAACATLPPMPPDYMLPVRQIVLHAACELRTALRTIEASHPSFKPGQWAISITLTPKLDTELSVRAGITGKSSSVTVPYFNTWVLGSAPGAEYDMKGHKDGTAKYTFHSAQLLDKYDKYPLDCDASTPTYHALADILGVYDWLVRTSAAAEGPISKLTRVDAPTYNSQIVVQWDGSGNFTYNFPFGTNFAGLFASYKLDESLAIAFIWDPPPPKKLVVRTLPKGTGYFSISSAPPSHISPQAQSKLDLLSLEQTIRNLDSTISSRRR